MIFVVFKKPGGGLGVRGVNKYNGLNAGDTLSKIYVFVPFLAHTLCRLAYRTPDGGEGNKFALPSDYSAALNGDSEVRVYAFDVPPDMTATGGTVYATFCFNMDGGGQAYTETFSFNVNGITPPAFPEGEADGNSFGAVLQKIANAYATLSSCFSDAVREAKAAAAAASTSKNTAIAEMETYSEYLETVRNDFNGLIGPDGTIQTAVNEAKSEFYKAKEDAKQEILNAGSIFEAGEFYEDKNANIFSGDSRNNTGDHGDDVVGDGAKCNAILNSGGGNKVNGNHNLISGALNECDAENCIIVGLGNKALRTEREIYGDKHSYGHRAALFGRYLISSANDQFWCGRWNVQKDGVLFGVGGGTGDDHRSNAFVVYPGGTASVGADPIGDMDVVTKRFLMEKVGSIESALDDIIAIQQALMGGA